MGEKVWFCSSCGDGPNGIWQVVCISCSHMRCDSCLVHDEKIDYKGKHDKKTDNKGSHGKRAHTESASKSQSLQVPRLQSHGSTVHPKRTPGAAQSGSKVDFQSDRLHLQQPTAAGGMGKQPHMAPGQALTGLPRYPRWFTPARFKGVGGFGAGRLTAPRSPTTYVDLTEERLGDSERILHSVSRDDSHYFPSTLSARRPTSSSLPFQPPHSISAVQTDIDDDVIGDADEGFIDDDSKPTPEPGSSMNIASAIDEVPAPPKSAYYSVRVEDTALVCSTASIGSTLDCSKDLQKFVAYFGDTLISQTQAQTWINDALDRNTLEEVERCLNGLLRTYAIELAMSNTNNIVTLATRLIQRHHQQISQYFRSNATPRPASFDSMTLQPQELNKQFSLPGGVGLLEKPAFPSNYRQSDGEEEELAKAYLNFASVRALLISGNPFRRLVTALLGALLPKMEAIKFEVLGALSSKQWDESVTPVAQSETPEKLHCVFELNWKPLEFIRSQFPNQDPDLSTIVTLTGTPLRAYGTTCSEYIQKTWPRTGAFFLSAIQETLKRARFLDNESIEPYTAQLGGLEIELTVLCESLKVAAAATSDDLVELAQQMSWISAAMSVSPFDDDKVAYCKTNLIRVSEPNSLEEPQSFKVELNFERLDPAQNSCWLSLFNNAIIAHGFPIPQRHDEMGLEIPIELMAALAGVCHAVDFEGGVVMKGFSSMFVPVKRNQDRVQWHLITSSDCNTQLTYWDAIKRCHDRALINEVNLETLRETRAIVGWCSVAETYLGRDDVRYEDIKYSGARIAESSPRCTGGSLGFQQFATASLQFTLGPKDGKRHFQLSGPYQNIISAAEKRQIILYDTDQKRAWLVRVSEVILHIAQCRNRLKPFEIDGSPVKIQYRECAYKTLLENALSIPLKREYTYLRDMVSDIWSRLELLLEENVNQDKLPGNPVRHSRKPMLFGYDFKAVVDDLSPLERKQCPIDKSSGGWLSFAQDINAVVLLARGFGEILRPVQGNNKQLCGAWRRLPEGHDYLATSVGVLLDCYDKAGCEQSHEYLTSTRLCWHRGKSHLFEPCVSLHQDQCKCNRLQRIWQESIMRRVIPPGKLEPNGAVIFGRSAYVLSKSSKSRGQTQPFVYSQPNAPFMSSIQQQSPEDTMDSSEGESFSPHEEFSDTVASSTASSTSRDQAVTDIAGLELIRHPPSRGNKRLRRRESYGDLRHELGSCEQLRRCAQKKLTGLDQARSKVHPHDSSLKLDIELPDIEEMRNLRQKTQFSVD